MSKFERIEKGLARARRAIKEAAQSRSYRSYAEEDFFPRGSVYTNPYAFCQLRFFLQLFFLSLLRTSKLISKLILNFCAAIDKY